MTKDPAGPTLLTDWITIWHSEWAALATDRELGEAAQRSAAAWADAAVALTAAADASGLAGAAAPPRPAPAAAAPDPRDAALAALGARVEQLERELAALARA